MPEGRSGRRFSDESQGYSEQAAEVMRGADGLAFEVFDERIAAIARQFPDFRDAEKAGAILRAGTIDALAAAIGAPSEALHAELDHIASARASQTPDRFGRTFHAGSELKPPFLAIKVTGALFHTQGGLMITPEARVMREDGTALPNLFAAGGAAVGVSGNSARGYLSGNGLLTATVFGRLAGEGAARLGLH